MTATRDVRAPASSMSLDRLARLHDTRARRVRKKLAGKAIDEHDFDDISQEAFIAAMRGICGYRGDEGGVTAWLEVIIRNRYLNFIRSRTGRERREGFVGLQWERRLRDNLRGEPTLASKAGIVAAAMDLLSEADQRVLWLRCVEGYTVDEIASRSGLGVFAIRKRVTRAKEKLRAAYSQVESDPDILA